MVKLKIIILIVIIIINKKNLNTIISIEEKPFFFKKIKNIRISAYKLNIIIYIINIIVGSGVTARLEALESDVTTKPNTF
jgi:hypothetical protein